MDIFILIVFLIYLILFDNKKIIKRLFFIYLILIILYNFYKCVFIKKIEGFESLDNNDYNKKIYDILKENMLLLQDVNSLKQYETNLKDSVDKLKLDVNSLNQNDTNIIDSINKLKLDVETFKTNTQKDINNVITKFDVIRTGSVYIGDIDKISRTLTVTGDLTSALIEGGSLSNMSDLYLTINYSDKGYIPIILFSYKDIHATTSNVNDIGPITILENTNKFCKLYIEETQSILQKATLYITLIKPDIKI